ncbi:hypothetical protein L195_g022227, partial [Trifolium pratense]
ATALGGLEHEHTSSYDMPFLPDNSEICESDLEKALNLHDSRFNVGARAGRSSSEAQVVMQVRALFFLCYHDIGSWYEVSTAVHQRTCGAHWVLPSRPNFLHTYELRAFRTTTRLVVPGVR